MGFYLMKTIYKKMLLTTISVFIASCATLGSSYKQVKDKLNDHPADKARIIVLRTNEHKLYSMRSAPIKIDNVGVSSCPMGGFDYFDVFPGRHEIVTETWDNPGQCGFSVEPKAGEQYYFEVIPRNSSFNPWFMVGILGGAVGGVISGYMSTSLDKGEKGCRGMFALVPLSRDEANNKILELNIVEK